MIPNASGANRGRFVDTDGHQRVSSERVDVEADKRYRRADMSEVHALQARKRFAENISRGEAGIRLAEAALLAVAEDDAIASHSTVPFPVSAYLDRIQRMAEELATARLPQLQQPSITTTTTDHQAALLQAVDTYLYEERQLSIAPFGRTNIPPQSKVDHPGTWEDARYGYLNELLIRRVGHAAAVAILHAEVMQRLLQLGALDFGVTMDCGDYSRRPRAVALPGLARAALLQPDGSALNTCSSAVLVELLRYLKRAYWPCPWDSSIDDPLRGGCGSFGGFRGAAKVLLDEEVSAAMRAISVVAQHRLDRGIWTSPGAGDLRRAIAACEKLVIMVGGEQPEERRDLAVLLMHAGQLGRARAELEAYADATSAAGQRSGQAGEFDRALVLRLLGVLRGMEGLGGAVAVTSVQSVLEADLDEVVQRVGSKKVPLTW